MVCVEIRSVATVDNNQIYLFILKKNKLKTMNLRHKNNIGIGCRQLIQVDKRYIKG